MTLMIYNQNGMLYNPTFESACVMQVKGECCPDKGNAIEPGEKVVTENEVINPPCSVGGQGMAHPRRFS